MAALRYMTIVSVHYTTIVISQNYFIHTFEEANEGPLNVPYPNGHCTLNGSVPSAEYYFFDCFNSDSFYCDNNNDHQCQVIPQCDPGSSTASYDTRISQTNSLHYGECPDSLFGVNTNYAEIALYSSSSATNDGCPSSPHFTLFGTISIATDICVIQSDATYAKMTCDGFRAQMNQYNDNMCTQFNRSLIQYSRLCDYYTMDQTSKMYQRLEGCYVDGNNQLQPTLSPTDNPTETPSISPTVEPTLSPTTDPTTTPTQSPSNQPTFKPTNVPSVTPTMHPTIEPTLVPTNEPIKSVKEARIPHTESVISDLSNLTLLYIIFGVLLLFYAFIGLYIWCEQRRKRSYLKFNFQRENEIDKQERAEYLAANELQQPGNGIRNNENNGVLLLDEDGYRQALINEGYAE